MIFLIKSYKDLLKANDIDEVDLSLEENPDYYPEEELLDICIDYIKDNDKGIKNLSWEKSNSGYIITEKRKDGR